MTATADLEALRQRLITSAEHVTASVEELRGALLAVRQALPLEQHESLSRNIAALADQVGQLVLTAAYETPNEPSAPLHVGQYL